MVRERLLAMSAAVLKVLAMLGAAGVVGLVLARRRAHPRWN
jgi:hypothetical protein